MPDGMSLAGLFTMRRGAKSPAETPARKILRIAGGVLLALFLIPLILTPLYWVIRPASTQMLFGWLTFQSVDRRWVSLDDMAPVLPRTVVTAEDSRYCEHRGVDWDAVSDVIDTTRGAPRGASTITMQTVKNLYLWQSRSYVRKFLEVPLAYYADAVLGKRRTLEIYLNVAEWGPGIYGVEAAAQRYFNRPASKLDARQASLLAAALPNPLVRNAGKPSARLQHLARILATRASRTAADISCLGL
jgi:monofunctional biosynthetic peptidoglycan transglycosylase